MHKIPKRPTQWVIGVDVGGTKIAAQVFAYDGTGLHALLDEPRTVPTPASLGPQAILASITEQVNHLANRFPQACAVGIGSAGAVSEQGQILSATDILPGWAGFPLSERVTTATGLPTTVVNDVHATALGESRFGTGQGHSRVLVVAVGTGIGGGLVIGDKLDPGARGLAGSVGHMTSGYASGLVCSCGQLGHLEAIASGPSLERYYLGLADAPLGLREIAKRARAGEALAVQTIELGATALGECLASAANLLDLDRIIVGGGVAGIGSLYFDTIQCAFAGQVMPALAGLEIVPAAHATNAPLLGAASEALQQV